MFQLILTTTISVLVGLIVTCVFNGVINLPKKKQQQKIERQNEKAQFKKELLETVSKNDEKIYEELQKQSRQDKEIIDDLHLCKLGLQAVIKNSLKTRYEKWIQLGYAPLDAKDDLERMYQVYHKLGQNGVMDEMRKKFLALSDTPPKQK